jgi:16S rRNA (guanine527-N7)-methyltransferase
VREKQAELARGAQLLGITLTPTQQKLLLDYVDVLFKWNNTYNLTAVREKAQMINRHILDSLSVIPFIKGEQIIDVGSGGGLPGVVLAVYFPDKHITLVDSNGKKTRFLQEVKRALSLDNVTVIQARVEKMETTKQFDCIISRAFAELADMINMTKPLLAVHGQFVAMKGKVSPEELSAIDKHYKVDVQPLKVPDSNAARHAVIITEGGQ